MIDIVLAQLPKLDGIDAAAIASSLKNFSQPKDAASARAAAKAKGALLYSPLYEFDDGVLVELARSGGAVVFSFSDVLKERGFRRGILLSRMRLLLNAARKRKCGFAACTLAKDEESLRNGRELTAFMAVLGMSDVERKGAEKISEALAK